MTVCSHDLIFTFVYRRWEGTTNDSCVFLDALIEEENNFPFSKDGNIINEYYVVDGGYSNCPRFLALLSQ